MINPFISESADLVTCYQFSSFLVRYCNPARHSEVPSTFLIQVFPPWTIEVLPPSANEEHPVYGCRESIVWPCRLGGTHLAFDSAYVAYVP
jgi:hypothetical protein